MKLPEDMPFVILDKNMYGTQDGIRLTEDFIEWLVRDCAKMCEGYAGISSMHIQQEALKECANGILARYGLE